jgi:hypothetical protein
MMGKKKTWLQQLDAHALSDLARRHLIPAALGLTGAIFALCLMAPIGWALGGLYITPVVLVALWSSSRHYFGITAVSTVSTVALTVSFFISPHWPNRLVALTCYVLPLVTIWEVSLLSVLRKWVQQRVQRSKILSVCASCKRIKDERGWTLEAYMQEAPGTLLRLGLCPSCAPKFGMGFQTGSLGEHGSGFRSPEISSSSGHPTSQPPVPDSSPPSHHASKIL